MKWFLTLVTYALISDRVHFTYDHQNKDTKFFFIFESVSLNWNHVSKRRARERGWKRVVSDECQVIRTRKVVVLEGEHKSHLTCDNPRLKTMIKKGKIVFSFNYLPKSMIYQRIAVPGILTMGWTFNLGA